MGCLHLPLLFLLSPLCLPRFLPALPLPVFVPVFFGIERAKGERTKETRDRKREGERREREREIERERRERKARARERSRERLLHDRLSPQCVFIPTLYECLSVFVPVVTCDRRDCGVHQLRASQTGR